MKILAVDPSGEYPGGTTAFCLYDTNTSEYKTWLRKANKYTSRLLYWKDVFKDILHAEIRMLIVEDYILYAHKAAAQSWGKMQTCRMLGAMEYQLQSEYQIHWQRAADVMTRWSDQILEHHGFIYKKGKRWYNAFTDTPIIEHEKDALRHAIHAAQFKIKEK